MSADPDRDPMRDDIAAGLDKLGNQARAALSAYQTAFLHFMEWAIYRDEHTRSQARKTLEFANQMIRAIPKHEAANAEAIDRALTSWIQATLPALDFAKRRHR